MTVIPYYDDIEFAEEGYEDDINNSEVILVEDEFRISIVTQQVNNIINAPKIYWTSANQNFV